MYTTSISLARQQTQQICEQAARLVKEREIPGYIVFTIEELTNRFVPSLEQELNYLESGDLEEWQDYLSNAVRELIKNGLDYVSILQVSRILIEATDTFFKEALPPLGEVDGQPAEKLVERLERRMTGFDTVASSIILAVGMQEKRNLSQLGMTGELVEKAS